MELYWNQKWSIPNTSWTIMGYSRASHRTGFYIHELSLMIDAGPQLSLFPETILITHCHADHIASLPFMLLGKDDKRSVNILVPKNTKVLLENYIVSLFSANMGKDVKITKITKFAKFTGIEGGDQINHVSNKHNLIIETFQCIHDVPTIAYGLNLKKNILKEEYRELIGNTDEIVKLKKSGVIITEEIIKKCIIFVWDTTIEIFEKYPIILTYPVIMVECTFITDDDYELSFKRNHIHWKSLRPYVVNNPTITFVLVHFSLRYPDELIRNFFSNEKLPNIYPWTNIVK